MSRPVMRFRSLWLTGVIGVLALAAAGFQSPQDKDKGKEQSSKDLEAAEDAYKRALTALKRQLETFEAQGEDDYKNKRIAALNIETERAKAATVDLTTSVSSPLKVKGGSVHGYAVLNFWQKGSANCGKTYSKDEYCVTVPNSYLLTSDYFSDDNGKGMEPAPQNTGWKILITSPNSQDGTGSTESVWLCNNSNCDATQRADASHVFFKRAQPANAEWNQPDGHNVYYHNRSGKGCDQITGDEDQDGPCDYILKAKLWVGNNNGPTTYTCNVQDSCVIGVGKP